MAHRGNPARAPRTARGQRALRITLLSLAVAILLLGAATAGAYGYAAIAHLG
jgi:hypothetical protein